ncbi:hypothetical protein QJS04_geneDACA005798 [Acorus gramineus]|uniref:DUF7731 domain-containing protein n=1 Tax=Acorus gramineus TaxID=55184 RepID=A0AAV9B1K3_ACOGR|nr:hypothetical protein QJS04_geneDACA005798 [Acorus gramineus]
MGEKGGLMDNTLVVVLLLIGLTINCADGEFDDPRKNVNLAPWQKWENANQCLLNITSDCSTKYTLTYKGWMNLTAADTDPYCKSGCKDHTWVVLDCVNLMKHDYEFQDSSTTQTIRDTIKQGCSSSMN